MKIGYTGTLAMLFALLSGCSSLAVRDMVATTPEIIELKERKTGTAAGDCLPKVAILTEQQKAECARIHFEQFFEIMTTATGPIDTLTAPQQVTPLQKRIDNDKSNADAIPNRLILSPVTQKMGEYVKSLVKTNKQLADDAGSLPPTHPQLSARELMAFGRLLSDNSGTLLRELQTAAEPNKAGKVNAEAAKKDKTGVTRLTCDKGDSHFGNMLYKYLKAYGSGTFVDRFGNNISKPALSLSGISDDDIQGLTTVFFEALFDCASKVPVFYSVGNNVELVHTPKKSDDAAPESTEPITSSTYVRNYFKAYITSGGGIPTAIKLEVANDQAVLSDSATSPGIKKCEAELIQQVAKLGGKFSRSLTGLAFGFLNNVNVSFVIGADFAVGDNKTLMHLAQTLAETWSRRVAEYVAWQNLLMPESAKC